MGERAPFLDEHGLQIRHSTDPGTSTAGPTFDAASVLDGPFNNFPRRYHAGSSSSTTRAANDNGFIPFYAKTTCADDFPLAGALRPLQRLARLRLVADSATRTSAVAADLAVDGSTARRVLQGESGLL